MARSKKSKTARVAKQPRGPVELVKWKGRPDEHDYPAAANYLSLLVADPQLRAHLVAELQGAPLVSYEAKDLLRASQLPQLTKANAHVALDLKKIRKRIPLSPVLLVRGATSWARSRCRSPTATTGCAPATSSTRTPPSRAG